MGLLDSFMGQGWDDPKSQAVMALAGGLLSGDFGAGVQGYGRVMSSAKDEAMKRKLAEMQMAEHQQKLDMQNQAIAVARAKQAALPEILKAPSQGAPAMSMDSMLPPELRAGTPTVSAVAPSAGGVDVMRGLRAGYTAPELEALAKLRNVNLDEVARTVKGMQNGREVEQQYDKYGRPVGSPMEQYKAPIMLDRGGQIDALSAYTQPGQSFGKTPTFADRTAAGNLAISQNRLAFDQQQAGKPQFHEGQWVSPPTFQNPNGTASPVPGYQKPLGEGPKKQLSGIQSLNGAIGEYLNELKDWGATSIVSPDARAAMGTKYNNMMLQAKEAYNLGVLNGPDYQILTSIVTDPASVKGAFTSNKAMGKQAEELARIMETINAPAAAGKKVESQQPARFDMLPPASNFSGKRMKSDDGKIYRSDGNKWVLEG